jgi:hypothetical protein
MDCGGSTPLCVSRRFGIALRPFFAASSRRVADKERLRQSGLQPPHSKSMDCGGSTPLCVSSMDCGGSTPLWYRFAIFLRSASSCRVAVKERLRQSGVQPPHSKTMDCGGSTPLCVSLSHRFAIFLRSTSSCRVAVKERLRQSGVRPPGLSRRVHGQRCAQPHEKRQRIPALETRNRPTKHKNCRKMPKRCQATALQRSRTDPAASSPTARRTPGATTAATCRRPSVP